MTRKSIRISPDLAAAAGCFVFMIWLHWPGYALYDTVMQVEAARAILHHQGTLWDIHPLVMSLMIALFDVFKAPLAGMLIFHHLMLWAGLLLFSRALFPGRPSVSSVLVFLLGFFPPVLAVAGAILKDVGHAYSLVFATGLIAYGTSQGSRRIVYSSLFPLYYATVVRSNAPPSTMPFFVYLAFFWLNSGGLNRVTSKVRKPIVAGSIAIGLMVSVLFANSLMTYKVLRADKLHQIQQLYLYDLTSMSLRLNDHRVPEHFMWNPPLSLDHLRTIYNADNCMYLFALRDTRELLKTTLDESEVVRLKEIWWHTIRENPQTYLSHRLDVTRRLLGLNPGSVCFPVFRGTGPNRLGFSFNPSRLHGALFDGLEAISTSLFFKGVLYVIVAFIFGVFAVLRKRWLSFVLMSSALLYVAPYFIVALACDFRYLYWPVMAVYLGVLACFSRVRQEPRFLKL